MKGSLLSWFAGLIVAIEEICPAWAALVSLYKIIFRRHTLFHLICPYRPESWAGSRAALPVS
jgi:hypothetical protein